MALFHYFDIVKRLRIYGQYICAFMALIVLNVSIDIPDELLYKSGNDLGINEVESVAEFVFEECMDEENSFPESEGDDEGTETNMKKGNNWKSVLHSLDTQLTYQSMFAGWLKIYNNNYTGIDYSNIPYSPPCSA